MPVRLRLCPSLPTVLLLLIISVSALAQKSQLNNPFVTRNARQLDSLRRVIERQQRQRTQDPALGRVPVERLDRIREELASQRQARAAAPMTWTERGPQGVTGTIRTFLVDPLDPNGRKVWAGSLTAGLWVNGNINSADSTWRCVSDGWDNRAVSALAADSANPQVRYAATGDLLSTLGGPDGGGIYKSTNGGSTWSRLSSTVPTSGTSLLQSAFLRVSKLVVGRGSAVYAATQYGLVRSADGGTSWQFTLAPQQNIGAQPVTNGDDRMTDVEMHSNGLLYAATGTGRIFRSITTAGTSWTEVTPPSTAPYTGVRTEISLGPLLKPGVEAIYAINIAYDNNYGGYTTRWLRRSGDGGKTWVTIAKPVNANYSGIDFTLGFGDNYLTMNIAPDDANTINISAYDQLYRSTDAGKTWSAGIFIDRTTAMLQTSTQRVVWGGDVAVRYASVMSTLAKQGFTDAQNGRTKGFGGLSANGVAMRNSAGSVYRLIGSRGEPGLLEMPVSGGSATAAQVSYQAYPLRPYVDQDEPGLQLATTPGDGFLWRNTAQSADWTYTSTSLATGNTSLNDLSDYDSRTNTLYYWAGNYLTATFGSASGPTADPVFKALSTTLAQPTTLKVGALPNTLFVATIDAKLYRLTATNQSTMVVTAIDRGAFPANSAISSIDVGATNDELIVTMANYGIKSVWYTTNGGTTWTSKDDSGSGLPDLPVYDVLMNPANRKQVLLATELGLWATDDITATSPGWTLSNGSMPAIRTVQLAYRAADGRVAVATDGRGVWETNAWAIANPASPTLTVGRLAQTSVCAGSTLPVPFTLVNGNGTPLEVRLSDAQGNFTTSVLVGRGTTSPLSVTLPASATYGTRYRLRLDVPDLNLTAMASQTLTISDLLTQQPYIADRRNAADSRLALIRFTDGYICVGDTATLYANVPGRPLSTSATYRWAVDETVLTAATSATLKTSQTGTYSFTVTEFGCTATNADGFLLKATDSPAPIVLNPTPDDGPICAGQKAPLVASYLGERAAYQWFRNEAVIPGATSAIFSATQTGAYTYSVAKGSCGVAAPPIVLTFSKAILASPIAVVGDVAPTLCGSNTVQLYATRQPDSTAYQWLRNGYPLASQTTPDLTVTDEGVYALQVLRGGCKAVSSPVSVTTSTQLATGFYSFGSTTACTGEGISLYAKRYDQSLQWMRNGVDIPGETDLFYEAKTSGTYTLRATSGGCSATAVAVSLVFSQTITPKLTSNERCTSVDLSTQDYPRSGTTSFYWLRNGQVVASGDQSYQTIYTSGTYSLSVTNGVCRGVSAPLALTIGQPAPPVIEASGAVLRCPNSAVDLIVSKGPYSVWKRNGVRIDNANSFHYAATESGVYTVAYEDGSCTTESNALTITFGQSASATLAGRTLIQPGQSTTLAIGLAGTAPWSLSLSTGQLITNTTQSPYSLTVAPARSTSYSVVSVANSCGLGTVTGFARVFVGGADVSLSSWVSKRQTSVDSVIIQTVRVYNAGPDPAEGLALTNRLPAGTSYVGSASGVSTTSYTVGTLAAGQSMTLSFGIKTKRTGAFVNAVEVSACDTPDPDSEPGTGTADGEDDATLADWRTADTTRYYAISPNPNGRVLPAVAMNQPPPVPNKADLSLMLWTSRRVVASKTDTIQVVLKIQNRGGLPTTNVRASLTIPNGSFSTDGDNWFSVGGNASLSMSMGQVGANQSLTKIIYWIPTASGRLSSEILNSSVADPNSTPNNSSTRPGEDDEAIAEIRAF
ncbi:conserved repeat domain protein [Fibrella aestuarina BUZ 2]|uniref:Conserved repeat domain protein n=1 Tax=Fibrella aestuarina BUZ 2 TaxID=1166018 RepID=I0KGC3_9BACT|nr:DUF11 domain-containing protein [Fibrella aestuarina]CCH03176.1 conserved repeat domain protein [Fibrella aestuarina BUZ 2]